MNVEPLAAGIAHAVALVRRCRLAIDERRPVLVAVSGIDGAGKGFVGQRLVAALLADGLRAQLLGVDGWLALPAVRFSETAPGERFYAQGLRFDDLVGQVLAPLRVARSLRTVVAHLDETADRFEPRELVCHDLDVLVVEGVFLLRRDVRRWFDLGIWVECTFVTALERAIARAQEGLPAAATAQAYQRVYFPAQALHLERDAPREAAALRIANDERLAAGAASSPDADGAVACW
jgi:uridine kinase